MAMYVSLDPHMPIVVLETANDREKKSSSIVSRYFKSKVKI